MPDSVRPVVLTPEDTTLEPGDWQWAEESRQLVRLLRSYDLDVRQRPRPPEAGEKGVATELVLALGSSGAIGALTAVLLNWLNGRSTRRVTLTAGEGEHRRTVKVVGEGLSDASMRAAVLAALGQPGDEAADDEPAGDEPAGDEPAEAPAELRSADER